MSPSLANEDRCPSRFKRSLIVMYVFVKPFRCNSPTSTMHTCTTCQFTTAKKGNYERHLLTKKHKEKEKHCRCGKNFESRAGLWKHKCLIPLLETQQEMIQVLENTTMWQTLIIEELSDKDHMPINHYRSESRK